MYNCTMLQFPSYVQDFLKIFKDKNYQIYIVGGAVRDLLLGKEVTNWDFTTNATPEEILKLFPNAFYHNVYGTVTVPIDNNQMNQTSYGRLAESPLQKPM